MNLNLRSHANAVGRALMCVGVIFLAAVFFGGVACAAEDHAIAASDLPALKEHVGQAVEVSGAIASVSKSPTGSIIFVNFDRKPHAALVIVFFTSGSRAGSVKSDEELAPLVGKTVSVKGDLTDFKGDVQMTLRSLDEIHVVEASASPSP